VVSESSTSAGWNIVYCSAAAGSLRRHELADGDAVHLQPWEARHRPQLLLGLGERHVEDGLALLAPSRRYCSASVVLPEPGTPSIR
jgi:hypothetical protein